MINVRIGDGYTGGSAKVTEESALLVAGLNIPPDDSKLRIKPYRQFMTLNADGVTNNMLVDGSVTPQKFSISAVENNDIYITLLSFVIVDASAKLNKFGNIGSLTNGCKIEWTTGAETVVLAEALKSNWDFIRYCGGTPPIGSTANTFRASNVLGASEGYIPFKNLIQQVPPYGLKLRKGTVERITLTIQDDVSAIDQFDVIAEGFERIFND